MMFSRMAQPTNKFDGDKVFWAMFARNDIKSKIGLAGLGHICAFDDPNFVQQKEALVYDAAIYPNAADWYRASNAVDHSRNEYNKTEDKVINIIYNELSPQLAASLRQANNAFPVTARDLWNYLETQYGNAFNLTQADRNRLNSMLSKPIITQESYNSYKENILNVMQTLGVDLNSPNGLGTYVATITQGIMHDSRYKSAVEQLLNGNQNYTIQELDDRMSGAEQRSAYATNPFQPATAYEVNSAFNRHPGSNHGSNRADRGPISHHSYHSFNRPNQFNGFTSNGYSRSYPPPNQPYREQSAERRNRSDSVGRDSRRRQEYGTLPFEQYHNNRDKSRDRSRDRSRSRDSRYSDRHDSRNQDRYQRGGRRDSRDEDMHHRDTSSDYRNHDRYLRDASPAPVPSKRGNSPHPSK